jgi:hypothetical protein
MPLEFVAVFCGKFGGFFIFLQGCFATQISRSTSPGLVFPT